MSDSDSQWSSEDGPPVVACERRGSASSGWIVAEHGAERPGERAFLLPPKCCECLADTDNRWCQPNIQFDIPLCPECQKRWDRYWRVRHAWTLAMYAALWTCFLIAGWKLIKPQRFIEVLAVACGAFGLPTPFIFLPLVLSGWLGRLPAGLLRSRHSSEMRIRFRNLA